MCTQPPLPLHGIRVVEFAGLAPGPFAGLVLSDFGATVTRIDRPSSSSSAAPTPDLLTRSKRSLAISPKHPLGLEALKRVIREADVLIDPYRPGVLERLGLGPEVFLGKPGEVGGGKGENTRLVYARMGGFQRFGEYKDMAGHDLNYLALSGVLSMLSPGPNKPPNFPLNLLGDFGGGGLMCALGIILALFERTRSGRGQVVECDMVSGTRYLSTFPLLLRLAGDSLAFSSPPGSGLLDGGAPFYSCYTCKDGQFISVACLEPQFYTAFLHLLLKHYTPSPSSSNFTPCPETQHDRSTWPDLRAYLTQAFLTKTRDVWASIFLGSDACVAPVLNPPEAPSSLPQPHPNLRRTPARDATKPPSTLRPGKDSLAVLREVGVREEDVSRMVKDGAMSVWGEGVGKL